MSCYSAYIYNDVDDAVAAISLYQPDGSKQDYLEAFRAAVNSCSVG